MNLQYDITEKDWDLAQATSCRHYGAMGRSSWSARVAWWLVFIFLGVAAASSVGMFRKYSESIAFDFSFVFLAAVLSFGSLVAFHKLSAHAAKSSVLSSLGPFPLEHELTMSDSGITVQNRHGQSTFPWSSVVGIEPVFAHIMLKVRPASIIPIPPSAFSTDGDREAFFTHVSTRLGPNNSFKPTPLRGAA